jgi:hypothetical protein
MQHSPTVGLAVRALCLIGLFALTGSKDAVVAEQAGWGHCVVKGIGDPPVHWCECKAGPGSGGNYNCFIGGERSCADIMAECQL